MRLAMFACLLVVASSLPAMAVAQDTGPTLVLEGGLGAERSTWRGDYGVVGSGRLGLRLADWFTLNLQLREGYAAVDKRLLTTVSAGVGVEPRVAENTRLVVRVAGLHQHEEALAYAQTKPAGVLFGIGTGIRHRAGGELTVGAKYELLHMGPVDVTAGGDVSALWLPDDRGPTAYILAVLFLGLELHT